MQKEMQSSFQQLVQQLQEKSVPDSPSDTERSSQSTKIGAKKALSSALSSANEDLPKAKSGLALTKQALMAQDSPECSLDTAESSSGALTKPTSPGKHKGLKMTKFALQKHESVDRQDSLDYHEDLLPPRP